MNSVQWSRRFLGLRLFLALAAAGWEGLGAHVERGVEVIELVKERLLASVWGYDFDPHSNVVDVCVWRLRSKLGFELIKTVRGEGYRLAAGPPGIG